MAPRQKARFVMGLGGWSTFPIPGLSVPGILMSDGPHGLRRQYDTSTAILSESMPATCFPTASAMACSFDLGLIEEIGKALSEEAKSQGVSLILGPGINIKRSPLCGRNFEYFSEDPLLSGKMGAALVRGIQGGHVGACVKHFAANNREYFRMIQNSVVDLRALHEIYLKPFKIVIEESSPYAVMSAYNRLNGEYCGESEGLIAGVLRGAFGFSGIVVSDWGAVCSRINGVIAGLDLEMPYSGVEHTNRMLEAANTKEGFAEKLDACDLRLLDFVQKCVSDGEYASECNMQAHHSLARRAAERCAVLLKNDGDLLPLGEKPSVAVIGALFKEPRYQGMGSSLIAPARLENLGEEFKRAGISYEYAEGYGLRDDAPNPGLIDAAAGLSNAYDTAVIFAGLPPSWEIEGVDRTTLSLPDCQNAVIYACAKAFKHTVVVLMGGAPMELPWADGVTAILHMHLGGEAFASAAANLLTGKAAPCGRLAETYPLSLDDTPARYFFDDNPYNVEYRESIYVGYKYYDAVKKPVRYPFGFGLSYTRFEYSGFELTADSKKPSATVSFDIKNIGGLPGAETPQLYVTGLNSADLTLAAFAKVYLQPGETARVALTADADAFCYYEGGWKRQSRKVLLGKSSAEILFEGEVEVQGAKTPPDYPPAIDGRWDKDKFYALFGGAPPLIEKPKRPFDMNATLYDVEGTRMGGVINAIVEGYLQKNYHAEKNEMNIAVHRAVMENPFRALVSMSGGLFTYDMARATLRIADGKPVTGVFQWIAALARMKLKPKEEQDG